MVRFAIVGSGWRSLFYVRAAQAMPQRFAVCAMLCRTQAKAEAIARQYGVHTTLSEAEVESLKPDFIVSAVSKPDMYAVCAHWLDKGFAVLSETPAALDYESLCGAWRRHLAGQKLAVAEQYYLYPSYARLIRAVEAGKLGEPVSAALSAMHDYHAASMLRRLLCVDMEDFAVTGKKFSLPVTPTKTRYETLTSGEVCLKDETHLILEYAGGKAAFYSFCSEQYRSTIRSRYINVRGTRGEAVNDTLYFLGGDNLARRQKLSGTYAAKRLGLNEDEAAVAAVLSGMARYVATGRELYPLQYALEDAYTAILMTKAAEDPYKTYRSAPRPWAGKE